MTKTKQTRKQIHPRLFAALLAVMMLLSAIPVMQVSAAGSTFGLPVDNLSTTITCGINGYANHNGYDLGVSVNTALYSMFSGTATYYQRYIKSTMKSASYGNYIVVTSDDGKWQAYYCHLNSFNGFSLNSSINSCQNYPSSWNSNTCGEISVGSKHVSTGDLLGYSGSTGNSTGPHCHIGLKLNGSWVNPDDYISFSYTAHSQNTGSSFSSIDVAEGIYMIQSARDSNKYLDIQSDSTANRANIQLYQFTNNDVQKFRIEKCGDYYTIQSVYSGYWLDVALPIGQRANVQLYNSKDNNEEKWTFEDSGDGYVSIKNYYGYYVDIALDSTENNANIQVWDRVENDSQRWKLVHVSTDVAPGVYTICSAWNGNMMLDIQSDSTESGANIQLYQNTNNIVQRFRIEKCGDYYTIQSIYSGYWLDVKTPIGNRSNVQLYNSKENNEEKWTFEDANNGYVFIKNFYGYYVDIAHDSVENNANIQIYDKTENNSQRWKLLRLDNPYGCVDNATGGNGNVSIAGWAYDYDAPSTSLDIHVYLEDSTGKKTWLGATTANLPRADVNNAFGVTGNHGYCAKFYTKLTGTYTVRVYAINVGSGSVNPEIGYGTVTIKKCTSHTWNAGTVTKAATCTSAGTKSFTCTSCGETKTETIPASGHSYGAWTKLNDTQHQRVCSRNSSHVEKANHTWNAGTVTKAATCTEAGVKTYTCTTCSATKTETITALGHSYGAWTKLNDTQHQRVCSRNSSHVEKANHTWNSGTVTKAATCTATGVRTYTCSVCNGTKTETIAINASNHVNTTNVTATTSTCTVKGYTAGVYCNDCKKYISGHQEQPLAAHTITVINQRDATYDAEGYTGDQYCTTCKQTITTGTAIPKLVRPTDPTPTDPQPSNPQPSGGCKWCGQNHGGAFGWLVKIIHNILAAIFGAKY